MKLIKTFIVNGIILTLTSLILRCIGMFFNSYIAQKIGSEAVGLYGLLMSIYAFAVTISLSGINLATTKIISEEIAYGNFGNIKHIIKKFLIFSLLLGSITGILLITFSNFICNTLLYRKVSNIPFYLIAISLPFISMSACLSGYFSALRNTLKPASDDILENILKVILISILLNFFMPCGLEYICISLILGSIIPEIISFFYIYTLYKIDQKKYNKHLSRKFSVKSRLLKITVPVGLTSLIRSGLSTFKQILIPLGFEKYGNTSKQALSNYGLISGMAMPLVLFPNTIILAFSNLLIPEITEFKAKSQYSRIKRVIKTILKYTSIFSISFSLLVFIFAPQLSQFVYKSSKVIPYVKIISPLIPVMYIDNVIDAILKGLDKQVTVLKINILDSVTCILLIYFLIPTFGINSYIFIIYFSEIFNFVLSYLALKKATYKY